MTKRDFYDVLGVARDANDDDIKKAYRRMARRFHPDRFQGDEAKENEEKFKEGKEAYETLSDPQRRAAYDQYLNTAPNDLGLGSFSDIFGNASRGRRAGAENAFNEASRNNAPQFNASLELKAYAETGISQENSIRRSYALSVADAINANPSLLDSTSAPTVAKLLSKIPTFENGHKALNRALKTHGKATITDDTFAGISIQGSTLLACAQFLTSKTLKTFAETGVTVDQHTRKDYALSVANAINANPSLLDSTSAPTVAKLLSKIPTFEDGHKALNRALKTHGKATITDDTFAGIWIQGATLCACAKFLTSKTLKTFAETGVTVDQHTRKDYALSVANAINANPALLDSTSAPTVAKLLSKVPDYEGAHKELNKVLKTHGKGIITDDTFAGIWIQGATLCACAKFLTSKTLKTFAETGVTVDQHTRKDYALSVADAINANPSLLDSTSAPAVAKLLSKIPTFEDGHKALNRALKTHGKATITDDTFAGISIQGSTLLACAQFLTSKTLKAYAETGVTVDQHTRKDYALSVANAINANPALLDSTSAPTVAKLLSKVPDYEDAHKVLKSILSKYQSQQIQAECNVMQPHAFGS